MVPEHSECHRCDPEPLQRLGGKGGAEETEVHSSRDLGGWNHQEVLLWLAG